MFDNKPFEDIEKQAKHVIDLLNQEGARKKAIALKPFVPAEPLPPAISRRSSLSGLVAKHGFG